MNLFEDTTNKKILDYYKSIGCTDNQALVLSLYNYGLSYRNAGLKYYYDKYQSVKKENEISFCDYIAEIILSERLSEFSDPLSKTKEYLESNKKQDDDFLEFSNAPRRSRISPLFYYPKTKNNTRSMLGSLKGAVTNTPKLGSVEKAMSIDACEVDEDDSWDNFSDSGASFESACFASPDAFASQAGFSVPTFDSSDLFEQEGSIVNKVSEVVVEDFMEKISTDRYEVIEEKGFLSPLTSPTSTFRMTSNTAAFGILRNNRSRHLDSSMVRIEELLNNFEYKLSKPTKRMFNINTQMCDKPNSKNKLLFVGVQGKDIIPQRQNITLLLDISGSMSSNNVWTQAAMITIVKQLKDNDVLSLVCYSDKDRTVFANKTINKNSLDEFIETLYSIEITGCTWGSKGIETAYALANKTYIKDGINRVILMTDGDLNFGITDKGGLKDLILSKKDNGIFLSVLGTGLYNYKDDNLETLAKNGNGNYCTIDCIEDIKENIFDKYNSLVFTIAKDVKAQVEFNPKFVKNYRLLGYENRALKHEDFRNDAVISEPFGCGSYGVALYELEMQDGVSEIKSDLKYQQAVLTDADSICTVSVRYKEPLATESQELSVEVKNKTVEMKDNLLLAYVIVVIGERLRNSKYYNEKDKKFVTDMLYKNGLGDLYDKNADKFQTLMGFIEK